MATMDSMTTWSTAAGGRDLGLSWRDAVTARMIASGRYEPYEALVTAAAAALRLPDDAPRRLTDAWARMRPWPDATALEAIVVPYAFVTNCSTALAAEAVRRSRLRPAFTLAAAEAGWYKPRPEIYRLACDRAGVVPREALFVAGAAYDAAGAARAGLRSVLVARRPGERSTPAGVPVVASLGDALACL